MNRGGEFDTLKILAHGVENLANIEHKQIHNS